MTLANSSPQPFRPQGVTDAVENTPMMFSIAGSMAALTNLIPDPSTAGTFTCRPAAELETDFADFSSPGFIPVFHVLGSFVYGMIGTTLVPGRDQPFCYDLTANDFVVVGGTQDATTLPLSQPTTGTWTPPTMDQVGTLVLVTHPGFPGGAGAYFGWFDVSNPAAPVWNAGNTTVHPLVAVPTAVAQFNARAWYAVGNAVVWSDALAATTVTLGSQVLITNDNIPITALCGMPLSTPITGGIIAALLIFKGITSIYQVTGDSTTTNLLLQALNVASGTLAPNSIVPTPKGVAFVSPQGLRLIDFSMNISDPIGANGSGVTLPFIYAQDPTRMCAGYNVDTLRISVKNGKAPNQPWQEWWYNLVLQQWSGPHTFPASFIHAFSHELGDEHPSFIVAPQGVTGKLFDSHAFPQLAPVFIENGTQLSFVFETSVFPDTYQMSETNIVEQTVNMAFPAGLTLTAIAQDQNGSVLDQIQFTQTPVTIWGAFIWGAAVWRGALSKYRPWQLQWDKGITFRMLSLKMTAESVDGFQIGTIYSRYSQLGYLQQESP